jgi:rubrerythrin
MSKLRTLIVGREFRCRSCKTVFKPDPSDPKCPSCGRRFGEDEAIKELEKTPDRVVEL